MCEILRFTMLFKVQDIILSTLDKMNDTRMEDDLNSNIRTKMFAHHYTISNVLIARINFVADIRA